MNRASDERSARLRRMKLLATAILCAAATVFLLTFVVGEAGWVGFVRAGAEAAMVGGLADWFAVTALFRHPLGLPIPHTALIPNSKDQLATTLGNFITDKFLSAEVVCERLAKAGLVARAGRWASEEANAWLAASEISKVAAAIFEKQHPSDWSDASLRFVSEVLREQPLSPHAGKLLANVVASTAHHPAAALVLDQAGAAITTRRDDLSDLLRKTVEDQGLMAWLMITPKMSRDVVDAGAAELHKAATDPMHVIRQTTEGLLRDVCQELVSGGLAAKELDKVISEFLGHQDMNLWLLELFAEWAVTALRDLQDDDGQLVGRLTEVILSLGIRAVEDAEFQARLEGFVASAVLQVVAEYRQEFTQLVQHVVGGWSGEFAASQIETQVGRDLQFIRVNGTLVGALVGLAIHSVAVTLS